jgi:2,3-dihydroxybenzoate-AMP ligase
VAFLVCEGKTPTTRELAAFLKGRGLADHKAPDQVVAVADMPLTAVGKIDKKALAGMLSLM